MFKTEVSLSCDWQRDSYCCCKRTCQWSEIWDCTQEYCIKQRSQSRDWILPFYTFSPTIYLSRVIHAVHLTIHVVLSLWTEHTWSNLTSALSVKHDTPWRLCCRIKWYEYLAWGVRIRWSLWKQMIQMIIQGMTSIVLHVQRLASHSCQPWESWLQNISSFLVSLSLAHWDPWSWSVDSMVPGGIISRSHCSDLNSSLVWGYIFK